VLEESSSKGIPAILVHHYSNDRLLHLANRKHIMQADAVAGVNEMDVPRFLKGRFTNVSDGIDTDFFRRQNARPLKEAPRMPTILMPARLTREKGQLDLARAVKSLRDAGIQCGIAFAGRVDGSDFVAELRREIANAQMTESVQFLGPLGLEELRDWYAASAVLAFPTYHHEGLPRIVIEAQAMGLPVVAYESGGIAEGIISGKTGYLVRAGDIAGMAQRLKEILLSPALRAEMGRQGRTVVEEKFNLSSFAERHERLYLRVIAERRAAAGHLADDTNAQANVSAGGF
jgi:glycosyltransferase involved in cell wall biosynthesis